jgi:hypothetical protein
MFVYEYVGEVISHSAFVKRMKAYFDEGIRHFYFMMLQRDEVRHVVLQCSACLSVAEELCLVH